MNDTDFRPSAVASLENPCPDCGDTHDGFVDFIPPDGPQFEASEPRWSKGIDAMLSAKKQAATGSASVSSTTVATSLYA